MMQSTDHATDKESVKLDIADGIAHIRFNRPNVLNAVNVGLAEATLAAVRAIAAATNVRVILLSGEGRAFMAGGDLQGFHRDLAHAPQTARAMIDPMHEALALLTELPQPTVASVHGAVAGAGLSVMLICDFVVAADDTRFSFAYSRIGATLDGGCSWSLPRMVGLRKALEIALLADFIDAGEALRLGLINRIVSPAALQLESLALAKRLAEGPTQAYAGTIKLLRGSFARDLREQLNAEREVFCANAGSEDFGEGLKAFFEKRAPAFHGK